MPFAVEFALENEEATLDIILEFAPLENREHQRFMLRQELANAQSDLTAERGVGTMTAAQWQALHDHLNSFDALSAPVDAGSVFDARFIEAAHDGG